MESVAKQIDDLKKIPDLDKSKMAQWREIGMSVGKPEIVQEIKEAYLQTSNPLLEEIQKYSSAGNLPELKKCYHKMKSGCGNVGFTRLQMMCEFAEEALRGGMIKDPLTLQTISDTISVEFKNTVTLLETL